MILRSLSGAAAACLLLSGCAAAGYSGGGSSYSGVFSTKGAKPAPSYREPSSDHGRRERSYVDQSGDIVFRSDDETTVVQPDGDVTIIDRDPDGTRTIVDSDGGVRVLTPDGNCIGDC